MFLFLVQDILQISVMLIQLECHDKYSSYLTGTEYLNCTFEALRWGTGSVQADNLHALYLNAAN
jgi:hypothetical protein